MITSSLTEALGWTLLHSLWQATLIAGAFYLVRRVIRHRPAPVYSTALGALLLILGWSVYTFVDLYAPPRAAAATVVTRQAPTPLSTTAAPRVHEAAPMRESVDASWHGTAVAWVSHYIRFVTVGWLVGMVLLSARLAGGLWYLERLRHHRACPLPAWEATTAALAARLRLRRPVLVVASGLAKVPMVIGHLKPLILLPVALISSFPPEQIEAIIAHELAHVRRHDYWINLLQSLIEIVFFYHPAVRWLSSVVREEREKCCDDLAVSLLDGNTVVYAKALSEAESLPRSSAPLVLAFAPRRGNLLARIERLVHPGNSSASMVAKGVSILPVLLLVTYLAGGDTLARRAVKSGRPLATILATPQRLLTAAPSDSTQSAEQAVVMGSERPVTEAPTPDNLLQADTIPEKKNEQDHFSFQFGDSSSFSFGMNFSFDADDSVGQQGFHHWQFSGSDTFPDFTWNDSRWRDSMEELGETMETFSEELATYLEDSVDTKKVRQQLRAMRQELGRIEEEVESSWQSGDYQEKLNAVRDKLRHEESQLQQKLKKSQRKLSEKQRRDEENEWRNEENKQKLEEIQRDLEEARTQVHTRIHNNFDATVNRLEKELLADGLIKSGKEYRFELKSKGLYINRKKQDQEVLEKYRDLLEVSENTSFSITRTAR